MELQAIAQGLIQPYTYVEAQGWGNADGRYYGSDQLSKVIGLSRKTVNRLFDQGVLRGFRLPGGQRERRISRKSAQDLMARLGIEPEEPRTS